MSWTADLTDALCEYKTAGLTFDDAWRVGLAKHPPQLRELGILGSSLDTLEDQAGAAALEWLRGVMLDAWHGRPAAGTTAAENGQPSRLRGLRAALEDGLPVAEVPTGRRSQRFGTLAA
jgi:hypothetical protein